jgi:hypothetical protein
VLVNVIISNCVINLSVDKRAVIAEMLRLLNPGGRIGISDVNAEDHLTPLSAPSAVGHATMSDVPRALPPPGTGRRATAALKPARNICDTLMCGERRRHDERQQGFLERPRA